MGFLLTIFTIYLLACTRMAEKSDIVDNSKEISELQKQLDELKVENEKLRIRP